MNVKEKIGVLGFRVPSATAQYGSAPSASISALEAAAASGTKTERAAAALTLWNKWAADSLGPMSADPTAEELSRKSRRVQRLEHDCAAMAARAQRRLELSSAIRSQPIMLTGGGGGGRGGAGAGTDGGSVALLRTGSFNRETQYAVRERRKAAAYAAARAEGEAEADELGGVVTVGVPPPAVVPAAAAGAGSLSRAASFKSRNMLDALIASRAAASGGGGGAASVGSTSPKAGPNRTRPQSAAPLRGGSTYGGGNGGGSAAASGSSSRAARPRSAVPGAGGGSGGDRAFSRQASLAAGSVTGPPSPLMRSSSMAHRAASVMSGGSPGMGGGAGFMGPGLVSVPEGEFMALRQEVEQVSERLAATQAALEVQEDTEGQLREAIDLLRARLHSSGVREVEAQRRLAQHAKLEPLFDRLAECFTFSSPAEVVARLEFLEDDKLGTFDQLLRTQEEVTRLQQRLAESQKAGETVATRLTTEHLQGSSRLQEQNEQLRQELESMEGLVHRLTSRQAQLVALQTAVLQLWGKCSDDPQFSAAFGGPGAPSSGGPGSPGGGSRSRAVSPSRPANSKGASGHREDGGGGGGSVASGGGGGGIELSDPLSMLAMIEEFLTAKSDKLALKHFTEIQRVANHVWKQHFRSREDIRGRVVPTFEQLSKMADKMADKVRSVQDQAGRSQDSEKQLMKQLKRLQQQKRILEGELARRDELVKSIMGVPRRERPASATAELGRIIRHDATSASLASPSQAGGLGYGGYWAAGGASRAMSVASGMGYGGGGGGGGGVGGTSMIRGSRNAGGGEDLPSPASERGTLSRMQTQQRQQLHLQTQASSRARPVSAPYGASAVAAARTRGALAALAMAAPPPVTSGGTLATVLSPAVAGQVPQVTTDMPAGTHWRQYASTVGSAGGATAAAAQRTAPSRPPAGSLFYVGPAAQGGGVGGGGVEAAAAAAAEGGAAVEVGGVGTGPGVRGGGGGEGGMPSERWAAPQRSAIEQAFLTRLERRTRVT